MVNAYSHSESVKPQLELQDISIRNIECPTLRPAPDLEHYELHCDAVEWSLAEPIIIERAEDIKSRLNWRDKLEPFRHQVENLMRFCRRLPRPRGSFESIVCPVSSFSQGETARPTYG